MHPANQLPEYVILGIEDENRAYERCLEQAALGLVPIEDGDIHRLILERIQVDQDVELELDMFAFEVLEELVRVNDYSVALTLTNSVRALGYRIYQRCKQHRLYYHNQLCYRYERLHSSGALCLRKHHPDYHAYGRFAQHSDFGY